MDCGGNEAAPLGMIVDIENTEFLEIGPFVTSLVAPVVLGLAGSVGLDEAKTTRVCEGKVIEPIPELRKPKWKLKSDALACFWVPVSTGILKRSVMDSLAPGPTNEVARGTKARPPAIVELLIS